MGVNSSLRASLRPPSVDDFEAQRWKAELRHRLLGTASEHSRLGRYVLREQIGRGGMGLVYRAHDPKLDRAVAIKVLRRLDDDVTARLRREARALAELEHPNIVTIYDVGTSDGRTFIVMPLLSGTTLDSWTRQPRGHAERIAVLLQVAAALHAAHSAGILHRDVKPSNVMVDDSGHVSVLDFGLSRRNTAPTTARDPIDSAESMRSTTTGGTAGYVAPEQARGEPVDERADVYAFCMTAIECLTSKAPTPERGAVCSADELDALLADVPSQWRSGLRDGVRLDARRRLRSIEAVIEVLQRPPSARRRWFWVAAAAAVLSLGALPGTGDRVRPTPTTPTPPETTKVAEARAMLQTARQHLANEDHAAAESSLEQAFRIAIAAGDSDAEIAAALAMGQMLVKQRRATDAARWLRHLKTALARSPGTKANVDVEILASRVARAQGKLDVARVHADAAVSSLGPEATARQRSEALGNLGRIELLQGNSKASVETLSTALELARDAALQPALVGALLSDLGAAHLRHGDSDAARPALEESVRLLEGALAPDHSRLAMAAQNLAIVQWRGGDLDGAIVSFRRGVEAFEAALGPEHPEVAHALENLGTGLIYAQDHDAALEALNRALVIREGISGADHPDIARTLSYIAQAHEGAGQWPDAARFAERAHTMAEATLGRLHASTAEAVSARGRIAAARGEYDAARGFAEEALEIYDTIGSGQLERGAALASLGYALCGFPQAQCRPGSEDWSRALAAVREADTLFGEAGEVARTSQAALHSWASPLLDSSAAH